MTLSIDASPSTQSEPNKDCLPSPADTARSLGYGQHTDDASVGVNTEVFLARQSPSADVSDVNQVAFQTPAIVPSERENVVRPLDDYTSLKENLIEELYSPVYLTSKHFRSRIDYYINLVYASKVNRIEPSLAPTGSSLSSRKRRMPERLRAVISTSTTDSEMVSESLLERLQPPPQHRDNGEVKNFRTHETRKDDDTKKWRRQSHSDDLSYSAMSTQPLKVRARKVRRKKFSERTVVDELVALWTVLPLDEASEASALPQAIESLASLESATDPARGDHAS